MTAKERVEAVLFGGEPDHVPFTVYESKLPQCAVERKLRNEGLCIHMRNFSGIDSFTPNCQTETRHYKDPTTGKSLIRHTVHTPAGDLSSASEPAGFTSWRVEMPFKEPGDYDKIIALVNDVRYEPDYEAFLKAEAWIGGDMLLVPHLGYSPLQDILYDQMGVETFCIEWAERRDEVLRLYDALAERDRRSFQVMLEHPARIIQYCGNVSPQIMGRERFEKYILPMYNEFGAMLHEHGKLLAAHMDADCGPYAELLADSELDVIEAFTPSPDTDMSIAQARAAWPEKILWSNFPSSVHLSSDEVVYETACRMIDEDGGAKKLIIGITEDVPEYRWQDSFQAISRACMEHGRY